MSCDSTGNALVINSLYEDLTGLSIPHSEWRVHSGKGVAPADEARAAARRMCIGLGVPDPETDPRTAAFLQDIAGMKITVKQMWIMENAETIRQNTRLDTLGRVIHGRENYSGYRLADPAAVLEALREQGITPAHDRLIFEHVTHQFPDKETAPAVTSCQIVGVAANDSVQALVVSVNGSTRRPDGGTYHVTYSLAEGAKPRESNDLLADSEATVSPLLKPLPVDVERF